MNLNILHTQVDLACLQKEPLNQSQFQVHQLLLHLIQKGFVVYKDQTSISHQETASPLQFLATKSLTLKHRSIEVQ